MSKTHANVSTHAYYEGCSKLHSWHSSLIWHVWYWHNVGTMKQKWFGCEKEYGNLIMMMMIMHCSIEQNIITLLYKNMWKAWKS